MPSPLCFKSLPTARSSAPTMPSRQEAKMLCNDNAMVQRIRDDRNNVDPAEAKRLHDVLITLLERGRSNKMSPVVKAVLKRNPRRVLDIGCGRGALAIFLAVRGMAVTGIDLQQSDLDAGETLAVRLGVGNVAFIRMDACAITASGFDLALSTDFYEHLSPQSQSMHLRSVFQALAPRGVYIIRAPHRRNIRQQGPGHIGLPSYASLKRQAEEAGFSPRFSISHTAIAAPIAYHIPLEGWLESRRWSAYAVYKGLQKCGLANVIAHLEKPFITARKADDNEEKDRADGDSGRNSGTGTLL
jgi:2-polyprenyl-3-methyl-5-hydroxy-6-metoxy-1,4-benzoquinol methylase